MDAGHAVDRLVRDEGARVLATLIRLTGDIDLAHDAVQDAVVRALEGWGRDSVPENPRAWLTVTAKRRAIDLMRREARRAGKEAEALSMIEPALEPPDVIRDDLLRLIFTCCHPALARDAQVALALRTIGGLSTVEVARALLVSEATMAKRLTRAKQKIRHAGIRIGRRACRVQLDGVDVTAGPGALDPAAAGRRAERAHRAALGRALPRRVRRT
jgi:RNA polymerase sigma factor (sigma-70 family)